MKARVEGWVGAMVCAALFCAAHPAAACSPGKVRNLFAYEANMQAILDIEAAMARAQAANGYIPASAAAEITRQARAELVSEADFDAEYDVVQHRMVALLHVWRRSLSPEAGQYVHFGATTVDIYDTAAILQIDASLAEIDACLGEAITTMSTLASAHKATPMIGRTLGQHAQPITFGKKVSTWIGEYDRHRERVAELRARVRRSAILKGAVGDYSGLGPEAIAIEQSFAAELGFDAPYPADWHGTRDVIAEFGLVMGLIAKSHQRIGQEIFLLQSTDIGEVREALPEGVVGSSSMPHKRNPVAPERLVQHGRSIPRLGEILADDVVNLFERDNTSRLAPVIEEVAVESTSALRSLAGLLEDIEVDADAMRRNLDRTNGYAMSQRVAFALADHMDRTEAEALVKTIIHASAESGTAFADALAADPVVSSHLTRADIERLLDPADIDPQAVRQVERAVEAARK